MTAVAIFYKAQIVERVANGERLTDISESLGLPVGATAISKALVTDPDYRAAIQAGTIARLDRAEKAIEKAANKVDVSRARAYHSAIAWRAQREYPEQYGDRTTITVDIGAGLQDALARTRERVIDSSCDAMPDQGLESKAIEQQKP